MDFYCHEVLPPKEWDTMSTNRVTKRVRRLVRRTTEPVTKYTYPTPDDIEELYDRVGFQAFTPSSEVLAEQRVENKYERRIVRANDILDCAGFQLTLVQKAKIYSYMTMKLKANGAADYETEEVIRRVKLMFSERHIVQGLMYLSEMAAYYDITRIAD